MATSVQVTIFNPEIDFLLKAPGGMVSKDITKRTFRVYQWARIYGPRRTGNLVSKMEFDVRHGATGPRGRVTSKANYSMAVHEGARPHVIVPRKKQALFWPGARHPVRRVHHPGNRSNPFLTKALVRAVED